MIGASVFESDTFLDLPDFAKALYPCIILNADDNGPLNNMRALMRTFNAKSNALQKLVSVGLIINFGNGVYAITHWEQQKMCAGRTIRGRCVVLE
jgi:hypothetical protein